MTKPFSQACENNRQPILDVLNQHFAQCSRVLEVGSGTGQHAVFMSQHLPHLVWQTSDQSDYHQGIHAWISEEGGSNVLPPLQLKIGTEFDLPALYDGVFSANTAHIMQKAEVEALMAFVTDTLPTGGVFCQYGPFTENGEFSSQSNRDFHHSLLERGCGGYRDINELLDWATHLELVEKITMPANNLMLVWRKR